MDAETPGRFNLPNIPFALYSDGVTRKQLVKGNDVIRQNSVMEQIFNMTNQLFSKNMLSLRLH